uniref:Uncharacterized protein n=1 Tax=Arundo donax TaxID=35708 RepID=A0A0A8XXV9_ARUDO
MMSFAFRSEGKKYGTDELKLATRTSKEGVTGSQSQLTWSWSRLLEI